MWKSLVWVSSRCPRLWQEYATCRSALCKATTVTVLLRNVSSSRTWSVLGAPNPSHDDGRGCEAPWSMRLRGDAIGGRCWGVRAVIAGEQKDDDDGHVVAVAIDDVEGQPDARAVKMLLMGELYENLAPPSRVGGDSNPGALRMEPSEATERRDVRDPAAVDVAVDGDLEPGCLDARHHDAPRFHSDPITRHPPRPLSQWNPLAGPAEYRRRRTVSDAKFGGNGLHHQGSLREFTHHAANETYLITRLTITLLKLLGIGTRWIGKFIRLGLYAIFLMPGFIQGPYSTSGSPYSPMSVKGVARFVRGPYYHSSVETCGGQVLMAAMGYFYYFDKRVHRSIIYGDQPRNRFDLYIPLEAGDKPKPVVIFITGGAWVIGYKAWGSLLAQQLVERDIIVACIDYRNFPQGCISDMIADVSTGIGYVYQNVEIYGGDRNKVYLAGQSAGAHLAACALLMQAEKEITEDPAKLAWRSSQLKAYLAISGGYNLIKLVEYFHSRGLYKSIMLRVMEGENSLPIYSPEYMVKTPTFKKAIPLLPPITLFHGTGDYSIPHEASEAFAVALRSVGAQVNTVLYPDKTHTDLFLQDPMRGGKDELLADILAVVHANDEEARAEDVKTAFHRRRLVPELLLQLARRVSPF